MGCVGGAVCSCSSHLGLLMFPLSTQILAILEARQLSSDRQQKAAEVSNGAVPAGCVGD